MVIKLYISGISGNKEVKKKQQRVQMILDSKQIDYEAIDITEPGKEKDKEFMQQNGKVRESLGKYPLPPQIFNDEDFCGDYEDFDLANEVDELEKFLHIESAKDSETDSKENEGSKSLTGSEKHGSVDSVYNPYEYHTFKIKYDGVNGLKEQIINTIDLAGENIESEDMKKSEVNGECETVLEPSSEKVAENVETSAEDVIAPEKEESSTQESKANDGEGEKDNEENKEEEGEGEAAKKGEEEKEVETPEEKNVEKEETSPPAEETDDVKEEKEDVEIEKEEEKEEEEEEKESNDEEKSQED